MNQTRNMRTLIVEMVVIVASILLAFALDAWWDARLQSREGQVVRAALVSEFDAVRTEVAFSALRNRRIIAAADSILLLMRGATGPVEASAGTVAALILTPTTDARRGALDALIASGRLQLLGNDSLQGLVANWPAVLDDIREEEQAAKSFVHGQLMPYLSRVVELSPVFAWRLSERRSTASVPAEISAEPIRLLPEPELINLIETRRYLASYVIVETDVTLNAAFEKIRAALSR
jgi:hypothetical protein